MQVSTEKQLHWKTDQYCKTMYKSSSLKQIFPFCEANIGCNLK